MIDGTSRRNMDMLVAGDTACMPYAQLKLVNDLLCSGISSLVIVGWDCGPSGISGVMFEITSHP